ncbi:MarR family transcriptional regulator [Ureibacillus massiliensis 4400831 = CIP 108448 = CCUG 49529]|uniref:MarR family transcriptional regulator n=1 Tax=Ureibacillus massiliensis 4400831 = CIP 108448 = CCUG 49529 TaxID=1211035 RepID=A0A0A3IPF9_9BACL|nr:helix-turn-helix domain-containing protein [Ureibacillus massiliensis]KGR86664.1 MarR family transcriptional regulator [Ureibacillus massiliensis 4400831 = CIP 108448 = CCUG 49529]
MNRADFIGESIDFIHRYTMKSLQKTAEEHGVTIPQIRVIADVYAHNIVSIKQLSQNLKMTQSTVSDIVDRLIAKEFLVKSPNQKDKRLVDITLSPKLVEEIDESISELTSQSLIGVINLLSPSEQETVEKGMKLLVSAVKEKMIAEGIDNYDFIDILYFSEKDKRRK